MVLLLTLYPLSRSLLSLFKLILTSFEVGWLGYHIGSTNDEPRFREMRGSAQVDAAGLSPTQAELLLVLVYVPGTCVRSFQIRLFSLQ